MAAVIYMIMLCMSRVRVMVHRPYVGVSSTFAIVLLSMFFNKRRVRLNVQFILNMLVTMFHEGRQDSASPGWSQANGSKTRNGLATDIFPHLIVFFARQFTARISFG